MIDAKRSPAVRLSLSLIASMLAAVIGLFLVRCLATASWLHANNEVAGNYLQTVGTIYAVLLAFVVFVVWQQHNDTRSAVESEANELSDFYRTIRALPGGWRAGRSNLRDETGNCLGVDAARHCGSGAASAGAGG